MASALSFQNYSISTGGSYTTDPDDIAEDYNFSTGSTAWSSIDCYAYSVKVATLYFRDHLVLAYSSSSGYRVTSSTLDAYVTLYDSVTARSWYVQFNSYRFKSDGTVYGTDSSEKLALTSISTSKSYPTAMCQVYTYNLSGGTKDRTFAFSSSGTLNGSYLSSTATAAVGTSNYNLTVRANNITCTFNSNGGNESYSPVAKK